MADSPVLSTATDNPSGQGQTVTRADLTPSGPPPNQVIDDFKGLQTPTAMSYPADTPVYYTSLGINNYKRASWDAVGTLSVTDSIALPLPALLVDDQTVTYETVALGAVGAAALNAASPLVAQGATQDALRQAASAAATGAVAGVTSGFINQLRQSIASRFGDAGGGVLAAAGLSVNEFLTIMLRGPSYKERDLAWRFSPRSADESRRLNRIVVALKNAQAPSLSGVGQIFFSWPKIFQIKFRHVQDVDMGIRLFDFKPCVLASAVFNYTPSGAPSFYGSTSYPEGIEMRLKFIELEYWLTGQYRDESQQVSNGTASDRIFNGFNQLTPTKP